MTKDVKDHYSCWKQFCLGKYIMCQGGLCPLFWWGSWVPSNTVAWAEAYLRAKYHFDPSCVWPQYTTAQTDRQDRTRQTGQRSDSVRQTVLQTVAQKVTMRHVTLTLELDLDSIKMIQHTKYDKYVKDHFVQKLSSAHTDIHTTGRVLHTASWVVGNKLRACFSNSCTVSYAIRVTAASAQISGSRNVSPDAR